MAKEHPQPRLVAVTLQELLQAAQSELLGFVEALPDDEENSQRLRSGTEDLQLILDRTRAALRKLNGRLGDDTEIESSLAQQKLYASFRAFLRAELQLSAALLAMPPDMAAKMNLKHALIPIEVSIGEALQAYLALAAATRPLAKPEIGEPKLKR